MDCYLIIMNMVSVAAIIAALVLMYKTNQLNKKREALDKKTEALRRQRNP